MIDLVYNIKEGDRYRVGKIDVQIKGENPHTKITTVLNRFSIYPGQIADVRELRPAGGAGPVGAVAGAGVLGPVDRLDRGEALRLVALRRVGRARRRAGHLS